MKQQTKPTTKRKRLIIILSIIGVYIASLFIPFVAPFTKYPLYVVKCGGLPITATNFMASYSYSIPGGRQYFINYFGTGIYFCSEKEAENEGYHRSRLD